MVRQLEPVPGRVLVIGATSSIAIATMRRLAIRHARLVLIGRNLRKLHAVAQDLITRGAAGAEVIVGDLNDTNTHAAMLSDALPRLERIDCALIAHGVLGEQSVAEANFDAAWEVLHTNFISTVSLVTWLANYFERQGSGTLAVISSVAGDRGRKSNYVYGASKAALNVFLDGVRNRVDRHGVHVLTIKPGFVATPMTANLPHNALFARPEQVADGIVRAIQNRKDVAYVPWFWGGIMMIIRAVPGRVFKKMNL